MNVQLSIAAIEMTNVTAAPMPNAVSTRRDTPRNGQMPDEVVQHEVVDQRRAGFRSDQAD